MTVFEMLERILKGYPGATPDALGTYKSAFYAKFGKREGPHLEQAFVDTIAAFRPTARQPFPIPLDIEQHMPSIDHGGNVVSIRPYMEKRAAQSKTGYAGWADGQGAKIRANRPAPVAAACALLAMELGPRRENLILTAAEIGLCEGRALSQERARRFGPRMKTEDEWRRQVDEIRAEWAQQTGAA